jgi:hypothetical protein
LGDEKDERNPQKSVKERAEKQLGSRPREQPILNTGSEEPGDMFQRKLHLTG